MKNTETVKLTLYKQISEVQQMQLI